MRLLVLFWALAIAEVAFGQTAGSVSGSLTLNNRPVTLRRAYAHLSDNAEKLPGRKRELRILLADREVPADALVGGAFPPVWDLAMEGSVRGLLIELDPANPNTISIILLDKPAREGQSLTSLSMSRTGTKLFKEWNLSAGRVAGALDREEDQPTDGDLPAAVFSVRFDAPVNRDPPISADLKAPRAAKCPQVAALHRRLDAIAKADVTAIRAASSRRANKRIDHMPPSAFDDLKTMGKQIAAEQRKSLAKVQRVIVRGNRALVVLSKNEYASVVKEDGKWKADD